MTLLLDWLNLLVRWVHVIAAIMWIGDSFLFMWLDSHLTAPSRPRDGDVVGELWMTHSGGFYEVVKRKTLAQHELPAKLYWFKWESYTTWLSGFSLLCIVYYGGGAAFLVDRSVSDLSQAQATALSLALLPTGYLVYELLWATPLAKHQGALAGVGAGLLVGLAWALTHVFSGRGAYLQLGAMMATVMAANVFFRIIPSQRHMIAATTAGTPVDPRYGLRAKGRSIHNHYLTLPVLFTMLSNHFPSTYGHAQAWLVLTALGVFGVSLKYVMNFRARAHPLALASLGGSLLGFLFLTSPSKAGLPGLEGYASAPPVSFATVDAVLQARCVTCQSTCWRWPLTPCPWATSPASPRPSGTCWAPGWPRARTSRLGGPSSCRAPRHHRTQGTRRPRSWPRPASRRCAPAAMGSTATPTASRRRPSACGPATTRTSSGSARSPTSTCARSSSKGARPWARAP